MSLKIKEALLLLIVMQLGVIVGSSSVEPSEGEEDL